MLKPILPLLALLALGCSSTPKADDATAQQTAEVSATSEMETYPLEVCPVSGEPLPEEGYESLQVGGRELRFCCASCKSMAAKDPARAMAEFETALKDAQREDYPLDTCVVSGQALGSMGEPVELLVDDTLVRLCCAGCVGAVKGDPETYVAKIDAAR